MQSTTLGSRTNIGKSLHDIAESARDTTGQIGEKADRLVSDTTETATEYYNRSSKWLQQNYGKAISIVGAIAAVGTIGYLIGKNSEKSELPFPSQR